MLQSVHLDEDLVRRLPLPLAQLYRRAHNAKSAVDRHNAAYYLWEAALKLLGAVAIVEYAELGDDDPQLAERLKNLSRPTIGHWWEFVRRLVPVLAEPGLGRTQPAPPPVATAEHAPPGDGSSAPAVALADPPAAPLQGDARFDAIRTLLTKPQHELPLAAGLMAALNEAAGNKPASRGAVRLNELFDRLVNYRNREIGHGAAGQRPPHFYQTTADALLGGVAEILRQLDVLAGRRLIHVADVRRLATGQWLVERYELLGESPRRIDSLELPSSTPTAALPKPERVYLLPAADAQPAVTDARHSLHPLVLYVAETAEAFFLNSRAERGAGADFLCYSTGRPLRRDDLDADQRELLARLLRVPVDADVLGRWSEQSEAEQPETVADPTPAAIRTLGEFELISRVGSGAMGVVYRAWQPSLGRQVAVKCLLRTGDPKAEARFFREIHALGRVEHPHLVKIYTSDSDGSQWFYAMEFVEGADLGRVCELLSGSSAEQLDEVRWRQALTTARDQARSQEETVSDRSAVPGARGEPPAVAVNGAGELPSAAQAEGSVASDAAPPSPPDPSSSRESGRERNATRPQIRFSHGHLQAAVEIVRQAAGAAHALHEAGVIHRDIKPGNIMLTAEGSHAVLMDLGLAQLADDTNRKLTATRQFVGTLRYASPEQLWSAKLDRRTDVYSLGATLHELLTLRPMFSITEKTPTPELMNRISQAEPERPRRLNPRVPHDLEAIVLKCLEKSPERRYGTAAELAADLDRWQHGDPVTAQPPTLRYLLGKKLRRHRVAAITTGLGFLALLAASVVFVIKLNAAKNAALIAESKAIDAKNAAIVAQHDALEAKNRALKLADDNAKLAETERHSRQRADDQSQLALGTLKSVTFDIQSKLANVPRAQQVRKSLLKTAIAGLEKVGGGLGTATEAGHALISSHLDLGDLYISVGDEQAGNSTKLAREQYDLARREAEALLARDPRNAQANVDLLTALEDLGRADHNLGNYKAARKSFDRCLKMSQELVAADPKDAKASRHLWVAEYYVASVFERTDSEPNWAERDRKAEAIYGDAIKIAAQLAQADPNNTQARLDLATTYSAAASTSRMIDHLPQARRELEQAIEILKSLSKADPENLGLQSRLAKEYSSLREVWFWIDHEPLAHTELEKRALEIRERLALLDPENVAWQESLAYSYGDMAYRSALVDNRAASLDYNMKILRIAQKQAAADPENVYFQLKLVCSFYNMAVDAQETNDYEAAASYNEQMIAILETLLKDGKLSSDSWDTGKLESGKRALAWLRLAPRAIDDLDFALKQPADIVPNLLGARQSVLVSRGDHVAAAATAEKLVAFDMKEHSYAYTAACVYSRCAGAVAKQDGHHNLTGDQQKQAERYAARAIELLGQAAAAGVFKGRFKTDIRTDLKYSRDLDPIRGRDDFKKLYDEIMPGGAIEQPDNQK